MVTEAPIGAGLNGSADASAETAADGVLGGVSAGPDTLDAALAAARGVLRRVLSGLASWSLAPTSVSGISLALGICAGAWFTAGTRPANVKGAVALAAAYLAAFAARQLVQQGSQSVAAVRNPVGPIPDGRIPVGRISAGLAGWLAVLSSRTAECAVYIGLAVGAAAQGWRSMWSLVIAVLSLIVIRDTMTAISGLADSDLERDGPVRRALTAALTMPIGGRVLLVAVAASIWGARASLLGLLDWAIIAVGYGIGSGTLAWRRDRQPEEVAAPQQVWAEPSGLTILLGPARTELVDAAAGGFAEPGNLAGPGGFAGPAGFGPGRSEPAAGAALGMAGQAAEPIDSELADSELTDAEPAEDDSAPDNSAPDNSATDDGAPERAARLAMLLRCRDDGVISRWFGGLARGLLPPLPPALLALAAVAAGAQLGLGDLPGLLILAPALVMLLAAPGSSHPHDGRFDWLAPAVLQGGQYIYIAALGFGRGVPVAVTLLLCVAVAVRYADLGAVASPPLPGRRRGSGGDPALAGQPGPERGSWMGWDGRMILIGLGAAMGIATFAYLALAAYLGVLICWKITTSCLGLHDAGLRDTGLRDAGLREGDCR